MNERALKSGFNLVITAQRSIAGIDRDVAGNTDRYTFLYDRRHSEAEIQKFLDFYKYCNVIDERA